MSLNSCLNILLTSYVGRPLTQQPNFNLNLNIDININNEENINKHAQQLLKNIATNMFAPLNISLPSSLIPRFLSPKHHLGIDIPAVKVHEIDSLPEKPARALKHLLKLNHVNHAILFNHREFHNHMPHVSIDLCLSRTLEYSFQNLRSCPPHT